MGEVATSLPVVEGIQIFPLKQFRDERGMVMHMLRKDAIFFFPVAELYFSTVNKGFVKGWKRHKLITQNFSVVAGTLKLVIYDDRMASKTKGTVQEIFIGRDNYGLVRIPPLVWYGFQSVGQGEAVIANCIDLPHDPAESETKDINTRDIPYVF